MNLHLFYFVLCPAPKWLDQAILHFNEAFELCQACPPAALFSRICQGLAFCHGRSAPGLSMYYLNMSTSVTLRHQAVTRTGKRIRWKCCKSCTSLFQFQVAHLSQSALDSTFGKTARNYFLLIKPIVVASCSTIREIKLLPCDRNQELS